MLADNVPVPDPEVTARAAKNTIQRICAEHRACRNLVVLAQRSPALDVDVRFEPRACANDHVVFDNRVVANGDAGTNYGARMHTSGGSYLRGGINRHSLSG